MAKNAAASTLPKREVPANRDHSGSRLCFQRSSGPEICWRLFVVGWFSWFRRPVSDNPHGDARDAAHDFRLGWVVEDPHVLVGVRVRNHHQSPAVDLAPAAHVAIAQFGEVRGSEAFDLLQLLNTGD
jgi:hypothetical protein